MKRIPYEVNTELVLSTAHIPWADAAVFDQADHDGKIKNDRWWLECLELGYRILVCEELDDAVIALGHSAALLELTRLARKLKCKWLVLDPDGSIRDDIPKFDW